MVSHKIIKISGNTGKKKFFAVLTKEYSKKCVGIMNCNPSFVEKKLIALNPVPILFYM